MNDKAAFLRAICENLYDDTPRLVYADWLQEHGEEDRAEFIRVQCELEPMRDRYEIDRAAELHDREDELLEQHRKEWLGEMPAGWDAWEAGASVEFRRGFVDIMSMPVRTFLDIGGEIRRRYSTIRRAVMFRVNGYGERLAASPDLQGLAELELACWYSDDDAEAIAASPSLTELRLLEIWLGRQAGLADRRLCRIMAASKAWPRLRELTLLNPDGESERSRKRLVKIANEAAGREVAVYQRGYPELFPFAAEIGYNTFPGYLPDGRMAMATDDCSTAPPSLCLIKFDEKGNRIDEAINVPLPDDLLAVPVLDWFPHYERIKQHLVDTIGFRPGFIRIREGAAADCNNGPYRGFGEEWDQAGWPDTDDEASWQEWTCGIGGQIAWLIREGQYELGWGGWADKTGFVHTT